MFKRIHRSLLATALAAAGLAVAAPVASAQGVACDQRPGSTISEDALVRVYANRYGDQACLRPAGPVRSLRLARYARLPGVTPGAPSDITLAGPYVAYDQQSNGIGNAQIISVLDVATGAIRAAAVADNQDSVFLGSFVLNARGTVVSINDYEHCLSECTVISTLTENTAASVSTVLDSRTVNETTQPLTYPIDELGLSADGTVVYWLDEGQPREARIG